MNALTNEVLNEAYMIREHGVLRHGKACLLYWLHISTHITFISMCLGH